MTIPLDGGLVRQRTAPRAERGEYGAARQLWSSIPGELAEKMAPLSGAMVRDVIREIRRAVPAYAQPLEGKFREVLVGAVEMAIVKCFDTIANPDAAQTDWQAVLRYSGRMEYLEGRTMDSLQTAVRVGARVVWRHLSEHGRAMGVATDTLFVVADAIFAFERGVCGGDAAGRVQAAFGPGAVRGGVREARGLDGGRHRGEALPNFKGAYKVQAFKEKPDKATADRYVESGRYYWNSGMFVWRCDTVLGELAVHLPDAHAGVSPRQIVRLEGPIVPRQIERRNDTHFRWFLDGAQKTLAAVCTDAYRTVAPKTLVARLDAG